MGNKYSYWLESIYGLYAGDKRRLVKAFGNAEQVFRATDREITLIMCGDSGIEKPPTDENIILYQKYKQEYHGRQDSKYKTLTCEERCDLLLESRKACPDEIELEFNWQKLKKCGIDFYCITDPGYPEKLKNINTPPYGIYVKGSLPGNEISVGIVGSRRVSGYGRKMAQELGDILAGKGIPVISGMARGCDSIAQEAAMLKGGYTSAVLACGVDVCYPGELKSLYDRISTQGSIISELPPGTRPQPTYFPSRNRIIAALSDILIVIEAAEKSGSLITADFAIEQGKDVYACPGRIGDVMSVGCNRLIAQGAGIITSIYDFMEASGLGDYYSEDYSQKYSDSMSEVFGIRNIELSGNREETELSERKISKSGVARKEFEQARVELKTDMSGVDKEKYEIERKNLENMNSGSDEERLLHFMDYYPMSIQCISEHTDIAVNKLQSLLTRMELMGQVTQESPGFYRKM